MAAVAPAIDVLLFDLGGVLVDFSGVEDLMPLLPVAAPAEDVKARWVACSISNAFGTGQLSALLDHVDLAISSHQVGTRKPDPAIYRHALATLGVPADRVLFFDDASGNVEAAQALGMRGHVTAGPDAIRLALIADGLIPG